MRATAVTVLIAFCLSLALGIFCTRYTHHIALEYQQQIEDTALAIQEEQWQAALEMTLMLEKAWENHARLLSFFTDHSEVDAVSLGLTLLRVSIEEKERSHALFYAAELCQTLALVRARDAFVLKNIL